MSCNSADNLIFQEFSESIIKNLTEEDLTSFSNLKHDEDRIRFLYKFCGTEIVKKSNFKDVNVAKSEKEKGNCFYSKKQLKKAIECYSKGIIICPQNSVASQELLAVLAANRSAVLFEMNKLNEAIADVHYALENEERCPKHILYKLYIRLGKCYLVQNVKNEAIVYLKKAKQFLSEASLKENVLRDRTNEIEQLLKTAEQMSYSENKKEENKTESFDFPRNKKLPAAHISVDFNEDEYQGRFAVAKEDIDAGTFIIEEEPFCCVLSKDYHLRNCQNCAKSVVLPIACPNCSNVIFCSLVCKQKALDRFHSAECEILPKLIESNASVNCTMAMRIILSKNLSYFENFKNSSGNDNDYQLFKHVYGLCRNEKLRQPTDFLLFTAIALFLLKILKTTNYFQKETSDSRLSDSEAFIGGLILHFLQILQFNSHEISEIVPDSADLKTTKVYVSKDIGGALFPTLALFNHSCEPNIVRYNIGKKVVVRLIKNIKKGEGIYENYGPIYSTDSKPKRQEYLQNRYWFSCKCVPCIENWPLLEDMNISTFKIPCKTKTCSNFIVIDDNMDPFKTCETCGVKNTSTILTSLKMLQDIDSFLNSGEAHFKKKEFEKAITYFLSAIKVYHSNTIPPFPDYIKVQQRLRTCIINMGNIVNIL